MATSENKTASQKIKEKLSWLASLWSKYWSKYAQAIKTLWEKDKEQSWKIKQFIKEDVVPAMWKAIAPLKEAATDAIKPLWGALKAVAPMDLINAAKWEEFSKAWLALDVAWLVPVWKIAATWAKATVKTIAKQPVVKEVIEEAAPVLAKWSEKAKNLIDAAKWTFTKYLGKDARVKTAKDKLSRIEKAFKKDNAKLDPTQQSRIETYIRKEKERIKSLEQNSWLKHLANERKNVKVDKELQKIANPDWFLKKTWKWLAITAWLWVWWALLSTLDNNEDDKDNTVIPDAYEWLTDSWISQEEIEIPNAYENIWDESNNKEVATDTAKDTNSNIDTTKKEKSTSSTSTATKTSTSNASSSISAGTVYAQDGSSVPLLLMNWSYVVKKPDWSYYTLETWVTNENKRHKYTLAANKPLPF